MNDDENNRNDTPPGETPTEELPIEKNQEQDLRETDAQQNDYKEKYLRLLAENENLRRRVQRESQESIRFATQKVISEFLDPYDSFERALFHANYSPSEDVRAWAQGFKIIHQQLKDWLGSQGVHSYSSKGEVFNAQLHEAVDKMPTREFSANTVVEELQKGYKMLGRILRPAKVVVAAEIDETVVHGAEQELEETELNEHKNNAE